MGKEFTEEDAKLLDDLDLEPENVETKIYTALEERILAGFEDIERFVDEHNRLPEHGDDDDIFERLYAIRLDRILAQEDCLTLLATVDKQGILAQAKARTSAAITEDMTDSELLAALGVEEAEPEITQLKHVKPRSETKAAADEISNRKRCEEFDRFKPIFDKAQTEIEAGLRKTVKYKDSADYKVGDMFIVGGQKALVAGMNKIFVTGYERTDRRLRVIYDNGTESGFLLRSLQRSLNRDGNSRRILDSDATPPPLFSNEQNDGDVESGHIYVVRSKSDDPFIAEHRDLIHKIGMTKGDLKTRLSGAKKDPTFLLADIQVVASYTLSNINPTKLESLLHSFFAEARLDVTLRDRFGEAVEPREWFMLPLGIINRTVELLIQGELEHCQYDAKNAQLIDTRTNEAIPPLSL